MRSTFVFFTILLFVALTIAMTRAAEQAVVTIGDVYTAAQQRPDTAVDTILNSRQTPPVTTAPSASSGAGLLAVGLVVAAAAIVGLRVGGDFLRRLRLLRRSGQRGNGSSHNGHLGSYPQPPYGQPPYDPYPGSVPTNQPAQPPSVPRIPGAPSVPELPAGPQWPDGAA